MRARALLCGRSERVGQRACTESLPNSCSLSRHNLTHPVDVFDCIPDCYDGLKK